MKRERENWSLAGVREMGGGAGNWVRRTLQRAAVLAVAASVPAAWSAGGIQVANVAAGQAAISQAGAVTTIRTSTRNTIINFQKLSVGAGETLQFVQPSANSRVLNRIQGSEPTRIDGSLLSNGRVYMVNPAGVIFGNGAVVNVGQLYASAGHISDQDFMAGNDRFTDNTGMVRNEGTIHADQVHLIGQNVVNFGSIVVGEGGIITMTAGKDVYMAETMGPTGQTGVLVRVSGDGGTHEGAGVTNGGTLAAPRGQISMGAGDVYAAGIYNSGSLKARAITLNSGANTNVSVGNIDASNNAGKGGSVSLLGDRVGVDGGVVDASGSAGGGSIRVGGDFHGQGDTPTASRTYVAPDAVLKADGGVGGGGGAGDGGTVVVWSNEVTRFFGTVSATGGTLGGNGGRVEVSGKGNLVFSGVVNLGASLGVAGTLLLDPSSIDVNSAGGANFTLLSQVDQFSDPDSGSNKIDPATINAATGNVVLQATGDITFTSPVSMTNAGVGLTAQAGGNIAVNASITTSLTAVSGDTLQLHAGTDGSGNLTFSGAPTIRADGILLWAGIGNGSQATAKVDLSSKPVLANQAGSGPPSSLTIRQDASIADAQLLASDFTGAALPASYTLRSDGGLVTVATGANVTGTHLALTGNVAVLITTSLTLASLTTAGDTALGGNVAATGNVAFGGNVAIGQNTTLSGANLSVAGSILSQVGSVFTLTTSFTGNSVFGGSIGGTAGGELGALNITSNSVQFGNGTFVVNTKEDTGTNPTADGHLSVSGNLTLTGNTTVTVTTTTAVASLGAGVADVIFGGTIDSPTTHFALTVNTAGVTWFKGNVGSVAALGGVTTDSQGGAFEQTRLGNGGTVGMTVGSPITFADNVVLMADTTLTAPGASGDVTFNKTVNSEALQVWTLTVNAGGVIWFQDNVGGGVNGALGALTTTGNGALQLGNGGAFSITTLEDPVTHGGRTGAQNYGNATTLLGNVTLTALNTTALGSLAAGMADVTLGGALASDSGSGFGITVNTPGVTWFKGGVSGTAGDELGSITTDLQSGALELSKFGTSGSILVITKVAGGSTGNQTYNDKVVLTGNTEFRGNALAFNNTATAIDASTFDLTLTSLSMSFTGNDTVQGSGNLTVQPAANTDNIVLGTSGVVPNTLYLTLGALRSFKSGFTSITVGRLAGTGNITISSDDVTAPIETVIFRDPVTIRTPGGNVVVNSPAVATVPGLYGADNANLTLTALSTRLNSSLMTNGNSITINGNVSLGGGNIAIKSFGTDPTDLTSAGTAGGNITVTGSINDLGVSNLVVNAAGSVTSGAVSLQAVGNTTPLGSVQINGSSFTLASNITTTGAIAINSAVTGTGNITAGTTLAVAGNLTMTGNATAGGNISFGGNSTVTGNVISTGGNALFTGNTGVSGNTTISGGITALANLSVNNLSSGGNLAVTGDLTGTGNVTVTGASTVGGNLTLPGNMTSGGDVLVTGLSGISGKLVSTTGNITLTGNLALSGTSGVTATAGFLSLSNVSGTGNLTAGTTLGITGNVSLTGNMTGGGNVTIGGTTAATGNITSTAGLIALGNDAFVNGNLHAGTTIAATGNLTMTGSATAGGNISVTGLSNITGNLNSTGGGILLTGNAVLSGNAVAFSTFSALANLTLTGNVTAGGNVSIGGTTAATGNITSTTGSIALGNDAIVNGNLHTGTTIAATGNLTMTGSATAGGNISVTGLSSITGNLNSTGGGILLTGNAVLSGNAVASSTFSALANLTLTGNVTAGANVSIGGTTAATGNITSTAGSIALGNDAFVNGNLHANTTIAVTGNLTMTGSATAGGNISVTGLSNITGNLNSTGGGILLTDNAILHGNAVASSTFSAPANLTLTGNVAAGGNVMVGGVMVATGNITSTGGEITLTGNATVAGNLASVGNISIAGVPTIGGNITSSTGDINMTTDMVLTANSAFTAGGTTGITLGNVTGPFNLTLISNNASSRISVGQVGTSPGARLGNIAFNSANLVLLNGDIFALNVTFADNTAGFRNPVPTVSTIAHDGDLTINANGNFTMEQNQKLTVFSTTPGLGKLTILSNNHGMQLGDLSALLAITVNTGGVNNIINILNRPPSRETLPDGSLSANPDKGTDIVSAVTGPGGLVFVGTVRVTQTAGADKVQFASGAASLDMTNSATLVFEAGSTQNILITNEAVALSETNFLNGSTVLDLVAEGVGSNPVAAQGTAIPRDVQILSPERGQAISGAMKEALRELGIYARDLRTDEVIDYLMGRALYDDVPYKLDPTLQDNQVAANRLPYSPVLPMVDSYRKLFFGPELDAEGKAVLDANGKPKLVSQDSAIKNSLGLAWQLYRSENPDAATPAGFRGYLETHEKEDKKFSSALSNLNQLRDLLTSIRGLGLTPTEFDGSRKVLLSKVRPANIREEDFADAVMGPSSRSGSGSVTALRLSVLEKK